MIPEGYRVIGDDEVIRKSHKRWMLGICSYITPTQAGAHHIGRTRTYLLTNGLIGPRRIFLEYVGDYPQFEGWIPIGVNAPLQAGDVGVIVDKEKNKFPDNEKYTDPENGWPLPDWVEGAESFKDRWPTQADAWCVYRRAEKLAKSKAAAQVPQRPRRMLSNRHYSSPLPLP